MTRYPSYDIIEGMRASHDCDMAGLVRKTFAQSGMSLKHLATESGTGYAAVHGFFTGERDPQLSTVQRWCDVLGLELRPVRRGMRKGM